MIQGIVDSNVLQRMQDGFAELTNICIFCVDGDGQDVTAVSGDKEQAGRMLQMVGRQRMLALYDRICASSIEDQIVEDTEYANIKIAAAAVRVEDRPVLCWLACCVLAPQEFETGGRLAVGFPHMTDEAVLYRTLDLMRMWLQQVCQSGYSKNAAEAESRRDKFLQAQMRETLRQSECMTRILRVLVRNEPFEQQAQQVLETAQGCVAASCMQLLQLSRDRRTVDVISEFLAPGQTSLFDERHEIERPVIAEGDKNLVVSEGTLVSADVRSYMQEKGITAFMSLPVTIRGEISMYLCVYECRNKRSWQIGEVKFITDMAGLLQGMLNHRVARHSVASSYRTMTEIMNMVGSCIYVRDVDNGQILFANDLLRHHFEQELREGTLDALLDNARQPDIRDGFCELYHAVCGRWYDMHYTYLEWVDGRRAAFYSLYDITDKKLYQEKIEQQAYTDFLTGLYNRMCCERDLALQIDKAKSTGQRGGLLYLDIDDFKHVNDSLGHESGDALLKFISGGFRQIKEIKNSCYRMGGDEFVIIIAPEHYDSFDRIVGEVSAIFTRPCRLKGKDYYATMSMGTCVFPNDGGDVQDLIKKADIAMYEAKKSGKNRIARFEKNYLSSKGRKNL